MLEADFDGTAYVSRYDSGYSLQTAASSAAAAYVLTVTPGAVENDVADFIISFTRQSDGAEIYSIAAAVFTGKGAA